MPADPRKKRTGRPPIDPMRVFTLVASAVFVAIGVMMIADGKKTGWWETGFFGLCFLVALFEPILPKPWLESEFRVVIADDGITCEFRRRRRESIRWDQVIRIWYVTTAEGPYLPDQWVVLEGEQSGCAVPTEAQGFDAIWNELHARFPGFDYAPVIHGGVTLAKHLCWERQRATGS
jgi:hypothetical protein